MSDPHQGTWLCGPRGEFIRAGKSARAPSKVALPTAAPTNAVLTLRKQNLRILPTLLVPAVVLLLLGCGSMPSESVSKDAVTRAAESSERTGALADCLQARGWPVNVDEGGTRVSFSLPLEQEDQYDADVSACSDELGFDTNNPVSNEQLEVLYAELNEMAECLEAEGYPISEAPSLQTFIDMTNSLEPWGPWMDIPPAQVSDAMDKCPQPPPTY